MPLGAVLKRKWGRRPEEDGELEMVSTQASTKSTFRSRFREFRLALNERMDEIPYFQQFRQILPPLNFITIHYIYFFITCMITSVIFWGSSDPAKSIGYTDSLFLVISAMTEAGLNTVNLSEMTTFQQVLLWLLIVIGSSIFVSIFTVHMRKRVFERRFEGIVRMERKGKKVKGRGRSLSAASKRTEMGRFVVGNGANGTPMFGNEKNEGGSIASGGVGLNGSAENVNGNEMVVPAEQEQLSVPNDASRPEDSDGVSPPELPTNPMDSVETRQQNTNDNANLSPASAVGLGLGLKHKLAESPVIIESNSSPRSRLQLQDRHQDRIAPVIHYLSTPPASSPEHRILTFAGVGAHPHSTNTSYRSPYSRGLTHRGTSERTVRLEELDEETQREELDHKKYPHYLTKHTTGRNAQFYGLSKEEREHLGGVEYRAISLLAWVVPVYFVLWQALGCVGLGWYMSVHNADVARGNGIDPWWLGVFNGASAFNNSGMSLLDANMIPFGTSTYTLITMGLLILAGNTAYPLFLRFSLSTLLWGFNFFYPSQDSHSKIKATLLFILRYPRRVYTNLFPLAPTLWLLFMLLTLNITDWVAFELLNIGNPATEAIPPRYRVLDGLFQALAVRSGGFYVIAIPSLRIGLQVLYVVMMYISVYPVVITMRHSNVYEERSLGIYADENSSSDSESEEIETGTSRRNKKEKGKNEKPPKLNRMYTTMKRTFTSTLGLMPTHEAGLPTRTTTGRQFIRQQIRGQLAHDLWWLVLAILFISCIEVSNFNRDPVTYSVFNIIFEVVSGYGSVGISTGLPDQAYSFSGGWHKSSKLILCAVMLRGRHRGLPVALDRAVRLPDWDGDFWGEEEEEDVGRRRSRSLGGGGGTPGLGRVRSRG